MIAGYPGETQAQFDELCDFVKEMRFDRLGCFAYSQEEDTPAAKLPQLPLEQAHRPDAGRVARYAPRRETFRQIYQQLLPLMSS